MSKKNENKRARIYLVVAATFIVLAGLWAVLATPETALAKKPGNGGPDGKTQDIPVRVVIDDLSGQGVLSDGGGAYIDSKKNHISTFVGRNAGQFILNTNTNNAEGGRTMTFNFPLDGSDPGFPDIDGDNNSYTVTPVAVEIYTARASVGADFGYVDLRAMKISDSESLALRIRLIVTDAQSSWTLNYRDVLWGGLEPGDDYYDENMDETDYVKVTRLEDTTDGKKMWTIDTNTGTMAYLRRSEQWGPAIPVGIYSMPMSLTITEK